MQVRRAHRHLYRDYACHRFLSVLAYARQSETATKSGSRGASIYYQAEFKASGGDQVAGNGAQLTRSLYLWRAY